MKYDLNIKLVHKRTRRVFIIDGYDSERQVFCVRRFLYGNTPYGTSQPRTAKQLDKHYSIATP